MRYKVRCIIIVFSLLLSTICFSEGARYLIITPDDFYDAVLPFAEWKTKKGMLAKVVKLSEIGSYPYYIRSYIIDAYNEWNPKPEYLLLVGDWHIINMPYHGGTNSDDYYTDIEGDLYNEIIPGRLPASNLEQVNTMVSKIIRYERDPYIGDTLWFRKGTVIVREDYDNDDSIYWDDSYYAINEMLRLGYVLIDTFSMVEGDNEGDVYNAINNGRTYVQFRGSSQYYWSSPFNVDPYSMTNGYELPVVMSGTCNTIMGYWPTIGEEFMSAGSATYPKGAIGFVGVTTSGYNLAYIRSAITKGFVDCLFRGLSILGKACENGRKNVYRLYNSEMHYHSVICYGDPEITIWTDNPRTLAVSYPQVINQGSAEVTVSVQNNNSSQPVVNALVCLMMDTTVYEYDYTDEFGNAVLTVNTQNTGGMFVTVTSKNYMPYEGEITVVPCGPILTYESFSLSDTLDGNGDDIINPGEHICLDVLLKNIGNETAESVYASISTDMGYISLIDSTTFFGDIPPDSDAWNMDSLSFLISPECPSGCTLDFLMDIYDKDGETWRMFIPTLYIKTCRLTIDTIVIYDTLPGCNSNFLPDPGETVHMSLFMENTGPSLLYSVEAFLKNIDGYVLLKDSLLYFGEIRPDSIAQSLNNVECIISPLAIPGYDLQFELDAIENGGTYIHVDTITFSLETGEVTSCVPTGPDDYGYYCYDNTDTISGLAPVFDWFEIAPPGPGSIITLITDEDARTTTLSIHFMFKYYGDDFNMISVCSNGFLALGYTDYRYGDNSAIPDTQGPANMVAPFWFDLDPSEYGDVYQYYDETNHRWICEFKECAHYGAPSIRETFQTILLDPQYYPTLTGDGEIIFQYEEVADISTATVGIENSSQDVGIQYYYNYDYDPAAAPIQSGRAIRFTTNPPQSSQTPWMLLEDYSVIDTSGNNNGLANAGEDFELYIYFENLGNTTAYSLNTRLSILDSLITTDDSVSSFGDIPVGEIVGNESDPYLMSISNQFSDSTARFYLHVESNGGDYTTLIPLQIEVGPPIIGIEGRGNYVFGLSQNYPNPMNRTACIDFQIPCDCEVRVDVYNVAGMHIKTLVDNDLKAGQHSVVWDGSDDDGRSVPGGIYFYKIEAGSKTMTRKLVKVR